MKTYFQLSRPRLRPCRLFKTASKWKRRGVAATEFAIVAPVFFMMVIGFIEFGRALMVQQVLINASRVGARQASTTGATNSAVQAAVKDYATSVAVPNVSVSVTPDPAAAKSGDTMTVTTSVNYSSVSWLGSPWYQHRRLSSGGRPRCRLRPRE